MMRAVLRTALACLATLATLVPGAAAREPSSRLFPLYAGASMRSWSSLPYGDVAAMPDDSLLIMSYEPRFKIVRVAADGSRTRVRIPVPDGSFHPQHLLPLADGSFFYAVEDRIWRVDPDGAVRVLAGRESDTQHFQYTGEGGPAVDATLRFPHGLAVDADGNVIFADWNRVLRVSPRGRITTVAGSGAFGFSGDGGEATLARLSDPTDVLVRGSGSYAFIDADNHRVREITSGGIIRTLAGNGSQPPNARNNGDGRPAVEAPLAGPREMTELPDGTLALASVTTVRKVDPGGIISKVANLRSPVRESRVGDFAGRNARPIDGMAVTPEGGLVLSVVEAVADAPLESLGVRRYGSRQSAYYLAPATTTRTLVALRDARVTEKLVTVAFDATQPGSVRLEVKQDDRVVASADMMVAAGRGAMSLRGAYGRETYDVTLTLTTPGARIAEDQVSLFTGQLLSRANLISSLTFLGHEGKPLCKRFSNRRFDCDVWRRRDFGYPRRCTATLTFDLTPAGVLFAREYRRPCRRFSAKPSYQGDWAVPVRVAGG